MSRYPCPIAGFLTLMIGLNGVAWGAEPPKPTDRQQAATERIMEFFARCTNRLAHNALADVETLEDFQQLRPQIREKMLDVLGLWPLPVKTDLKPTITGTVEHDDFVVEKLHFQSMPGLYVTANFYRPKVMDKPRPTVLYLCGHGRIKKGDISFGNKSHYQFHPAWFVRNGYCSLVIDTLQLGEIEGMHHGTYRFGKWWWLSRGYTPAGVEAWNAVRALDYLETRPEVDSSRIGVTGRSGGGTYTWWLAAIDDRPACLVPVAGITDLQNHIVDGCISGHCDCNYYGNIHGFDTVMYAAMAAPRPLLLSNSDKDTIFPLDGVYRIHTKLRKIYDLYGASDKLGLLITEGPHKDTQELRVPCFHWMNRWLTKEDPPIRQIAESFFEPEQLRVFETIPSDERNTTIDESFVPQAQIGEAPDSLAKWDQQREQWLGKLQAKSLSGWPKEPVAVDAKASEPLAVDGLTLETIEYTSEENLRFPVYVLRGQHAEPAKLLVVTVVDDAGWKTWLSGLPAAMQTAVTGEKEPTVDARSVEATTQMLTKNNWAMATVAPRGIGLNQWDQREKENTQIRRRFAVLGRTIDEGRIWDTRQAIHALRSQSAYQNARLWVQGEGPAAGIALYAGIFEPDVERFDLHKPSVTHRESPTLLQVLRTLDVPQAMALPFPRKVIVYDSPAENWTWTSKIAALYDATKPPLQFRSMTPSGKVSAP